MKSIPIILLTLFSLSVKQPQTLEHLALVDINEIMLCRSANYECELRQCNGIAGFINHCVCRLSIAGQIITAEDTL